MRPAHEAVCGLTRSGKSFYASEGRGRRHAGPVLVIDPQDSEHWLWPRADRRAAVPDVLAAAAAGGVVYVPGWDDRQGRAEVTHLMAGLLAWQQGAGRRRRQWLVIADEAHTYAPEGGPPGGLHLLARRGLRWGVSGVFVSQRPADVAKAVISQAERHVIFEPGAYGAPYFDKYGIDSAEVRRLLDEGRHLYRGRAAGGVGPWPYVVWEKGRLAGPLHM